MIEVLKAVGVLILAVTLIILSGLVLNYFVPFPFAHF